MAPPLCTDCTNSLTAGSTTNEDSPLSSDRGTHFTATLGAPRLALPTNFSARNVTTSFSVCLTIFPVWCWIFMTPWSLQFMHKICTVEETLMKPFRVRETPSNDKSLKPHYNILFHICSPYKTGVYAQAEYKCIYLRDAPLSCCSKVFVRLYSGVREKELLAGRLQEKEVLLIPHHELSPTVHGCRGAVNFAGVGPGRGSGRMRGKVPTLCEISRLV